jgi:hypothetical protein
MAEVPKQREFTGPSYVLPDDLADKPCSELGPETLLLWLNKTMQTCYDHKHEERSSVDAILQHCIERKFDFGMASAFVRSFWKSQLRQGLEKMKEKENADANMRENAIDETGEFVEKDIPPRRVWDVLSNRVVPFYWAQPTPTSAKGRSHFKSEKKSVSVKIAAFSHSWVEKGSRRSILTPINSREWPVPLPKSTSISHIRIELLNRIRFSEKRSTCHYAWLDVLCLRQQWKTTASDSDCYLNEDIRLAEWKLDVPTIGGIYQRARFIYTTSLALDALLWTRKSLQIDTGQLVRGRYRKHRIIPLTHGGGPNSAGQIAHPECTSMNWKAGRPSD